MSCSNPHRRIKVGTALQLAISFYQLSLSFFTRNSHFFYLCLFVICENLNSFKRQNKTCFIETCFIETCFIINCVGWTVRPFGSLPRTTFFMFSLNNSFSLKKMKKKVHEDYPIFLQFYTCVKIFIRIERIKNIFFACTVPLRASLIISEPQLMTD